jgi:hypothetical protein
VPALKDLAENDNFKLANQAFRISHFNQNCPVRALLASMDICLQPSSKKNLYGRWLYRSSIFTRKSQLLCQVRERDLRPEGPTECVRV